MPNLRNGSKGVSNPDSLDCESGILPLSYCSEVCSVSTMRMAYYCIGLVVDIIREAYDLFRPPTAIVSMKPSNAFVFVCSKRIVEIGRRQYATLADSDSNCCLKPFAVVPALAYPRRERPPAVYGHVINSPTHFNVPIRPSDERPSAMYGHFCLVPRVSVHDRYYCKYVITGHVRSGAL